MHDHSETAELKDILDRQFEDGRGIIHLSKSLDNENLVRLLREGMCRAKGRGFKVLVDGSTNTSGARAVTAYLSSSMSDDHIVRTIRPLLSHAPGVLITVVEPPTPEQKADYLLRCLEQCVGYVLSDEQRACATEILTTPTYDHNERSLLNRNKQLNCLVISRRVLW